MKQLLTVVVPVFNEEACLAALFARLQAVRQKMAELIRVEYLFVDDGSRDHSLAMLSALAAQHDYVQVIGFSRNFGHQIAVTAGIDHARGDWVALIDADLQDPPELLADMLQMAQQGFDVVYGQRRSRKGESLFKKVTAALFYRTLSRLCDVPIPRDTGDFRIMSRRVVDVLVRMRERHRFIRGMVPWIGFKSSAFLYDRDSRFAGETKYPLSKMLKFAGNAIFSFSAKPLALATQFGLCAVALGACGALYILYAKLFANYPIPGVATIVTALTLFGGVQTLLLGILGEYVGRMFEEAKGRPLYIVAERQNLPDQELPQ
jgi:dolichol-phosphate mannosyltransferase